MSRRNQQGRQVQQLGQESGAAPRAKVPWVSWGLDALLLLAVVAGGRAIHLLVGSWATWTYTALCLVFAWWALGSTLHNEDEDE